MTDPHPPRPFQELRDSGLLWLINRTVFHPRGYALAIAYDDDEAVGWSLLGDGSEPWQYADEVDERDLLRLAEETLRQTAAATVSEPNWFDQDDDEDEPSGTPAIVTVDTGGLT